jgi:hypothetical protein
MVKFNTKQEASDYAFDNLGTKLSDAIFSAFQNVGDMADEESITFDEAFDKYFDACLEAVYIT